MESIGHDFAVLFSNTDGGDFNKTFFYLTGIKSPEMALILAPDFEAEEALFNASGTWEYASTEAAAEAFPMGDLLGHVAQLATERTTAHLSFTDLGQLQGMDRVLPFMSTLENLDQRIAEMRVIKDPQEIESLRRASQITAEGLNDVFRALEAGMQEEDLGAMLETSFQRQGSPGSSFLQAASGPNATNVHFGAGERVIENGDVIVFDVGAWWNDYTADISRTIPVSGRFTKEQREIYTVVLNSQKAAIELMVPGASVDEVRERAQDVLIDGLHELGLVLDKENEAQRRFFIAHGYYHFIGLDIHDVWSEYSRSPGEKTYQPGMVMTMEPGLYFPADRVEAAVARLGSTPEDLEMKAFLETIRPVYEKYVDIGVRIEDDVLITENGNEILTASVPKEIEEIERMIRGDVPIM